MKALCIAGLWLVCASFSGAQATTVPDFADFTKSSSEHIINPIEKPFQVYSVAGTIRTERSGDALAEVLFEIEGPGTTRKIRHARTDKHGHFRISRVPRGTYRFKATLEGFQSVMGTIIVSDSKGASGEMAIHMSIGL